MNHIQIESFTNYIKKQKNVTLRKKRKLVVKTNNSHRGSRVIDPFEFSKPLDNGDNKSIAVKN